MILAIVSFESEKEVYHINGVDEIRIQLIVIDELRLKPWDDGTNLAEGFNELVAMRKESSAFR